LQWILVKLFANFPRKKTYLEVYLFERLVYSGSAKRELLTESLSLSSTLRLLEMTLYSPREDPLAGLLAN
jgi:hypothetical protein